MDRTRPGPIGFTVVLFLAAAAAGLVVGIVLRGFTIEIVAMALALGVAISLTSVGFRDVV